MKSLIVFSRDDRCILYGKVVEIWQKDITIVGPIYCPVDKTFHEREIHVFWSKEEEIKSLTLGSYVAIECEVKSIGLETIIEGGYTKANLCAGGKILRYSGKFHYPATSTMREVNVFIGTIIDVKFTKTNDGDMVENITIAYKWFGKTFKKNIAFFNASKPFEHEKQYVFVCGGLTASKSYVAYRIYECG
jgi:hypothetical protein